MVFPQERSSALTTYEPHGPILIQSDADFTAANGVRAGSGTPSDPYLISGWEINASSTGVQIIGVTASFVIRDMYIHSGGHGPTAYEAIFINHANGAAVEGNRLTTSYSGVSVAWSNSVRISNNTIEGNDYGVEASFSTRVVMEANHISGSHGYGISGYQITGSRIDNNNISTSGFVGILLTFGSDAQVDGNLLTGNPTGLWLQSSAGSIFHNRFVDNTIQARESFGSHYWDGGYPTGGNFWSNYAGVDQCHGPLQDNCIGGDGIGDTPYYLPGNASLDRYPLMQPYGTLDIPPVALISYSPLDPIVGEGITFNASGSYDHDGSIVAYNWTFDGNSSAEGPTVTHVFGTRGNHSVALRVTDDVGLTGSTAATFFARAPSQAIEDLITQVDVLVVQSNLTKGQGTSLGVPLQRALRDLSAGRSTGAIMDLQVFIRSVDLNVASGRMSASDGQGLIAVASRIVVALGGTR